MIYLAQIANLKSIYFLRILKNPEDRAIELDQRVKPYFGVDEGGLASNGEKIDLYKIWITRTDKYQPSLFKLDSPIIREINSSSKRVKIVLIDSNLNSEYKSTEFYYANACKEPYGNYWGGDIDKDKIINLIINNKLGEALRLLLSSPQTDETSRKAVITSLRHIQSIKNGKNRGEIPLNRVEVEMNNITLKVLDILEQIQ